MQSDDGSQGHVVAHGHGAGRRVSTQDAADDIVGRGRAVDPIIASDADMQASDRESLIGLIEPGDHIADPFERRAPGKLTHRRARRGCHRHGVADGTAPLADDDTHRRGSIEDHADAAVVEDRPVEKQARVAPAAAARDESAHDGQRTIDAREGGHAFISGQGPWIGQEDGEPVVVVELGQAGECEAPVRRGDGSEAEAARTRPGQVR